jgi:hypothetical protein
MTEAEKPIPQEDKKLAESLKLAGNKLFGGTRKY